MITQSKIYRDVAVHFNMQKRLATYSARRGEELKWEQPENKNRCIAHCCVTDVSLGKNIVDSCIGDNQKEPKDHSIESGALLAKEN